MGAALADRVPGCAGVQQVWITGHPGDGEGGAPKGLRCMGVPQGPDVQNTFPHPIHRAYQGNVTGAVLRHVHRLHGDSGLLQLLCRDSSNEDTTHMPSPAGEG